MILDFQVIVILFLDTESNKRAECYIPSLPSAPPPPPQAVGRC